MKAAYDGQTIYVGGPRLLEYLEAERSPMLVQFAQESGAKGQSVVYLVREQAVVAAFALADVVREESGAAVSALHAMGIEVAMLTGDSKDVANAVASELNIDQTFAEVLPSDKDQKVMELQGQGKLVAMVGDGVNDAPALTACRYRHRHWQRHRCRCRIRRAHFGEEQPAGRGEDRQTQPGQLP